LLAADNSAIWPPVGKVRRATKVFFLFDRSKNLKKQSIFEKISADAQKKVRERQFFGSDGNLNLVLGLYELVFRSRDFCNLCFMYFSLTMLNETITEFGFS